jgi:hypothetical protein
MSVENGRSAREQKHNLNRLTGLSHDGAWLCGVNNTVFFR